MANMTVGNIESPCVRNCCLDENDICMGCYRSVVEIIAWGTASNEERTMILLTTKQRKSELVKKRDWLRM